MRNIFSTKQTIEVHGCDHVQADWMSTIPWKMQTVVNQGLRAPDTHYCKAIKIVCRWMRSVVLQNADSKHTFMCRKEAIPSIEDIENEINYCTMHFASHFLYALEIIAYKHPEGSVADIAWKLYNGVTSELLHFNPETTGQLEIRLSDVDRPKKPIPCPIEESQDPYLRKF